MRSSSFSLPLLLAVLLSGCAIQSTVPLHHAKSGEFVLTASIEEPGAAYIPRASLAATIGVLDHADFTAGVSSAVLNISGYGVARFFYRKFEASFQAAYYTFTGEISLFDSVATGGFSLTPRVGVGLTEDIGFRYGLQATRFELGNVLYLGGAYGGFGWRLRNTPTVALQFEISTTPVVIDATEDDDFERVIPFGHLSFGISFWPSRRGTAAPEQIDPEQTDPNTPRPLL